MEGYLLVVAEDDVPSRDLLLLPTLINLEASCGEASGAGWTGCLCVVAHPRHHRLDQECCLSIVTTLSSSTTAPVSWAQTCRLS